jgi:hypothetical protein
MRKLVPVSVMVEHVVHTLRPVELANVPDAHAVHTLFPDVLAYVPAAHAVHAVTVDTTLYVPALHSEQPDVITYRPTGHKKGH